MSVSNERDVVVLRKLLTVLGNYTEKFPATKAETVFNKICETGLPMIPKGEKELVLLETILDSGRSVPAIVQDLFNLKALDIKEAE